MTCFGMQWEALTLLLIGISVNQLHTTKEGATALAVPIASVAYFYTLLFVSTMPHLLEEFRFFYQADTSI